VRNLQGNRLVLALTLLIVWTVIALEILFLGVWGDPPAIAWLGLAVPALVALGLSIAAFFLLRYERPRQGVPLEERAVGGDETHRILVVANETISAGALRAEIAGKAAGRPTEVLLVAPALVGPVRHWTDEEDAARAAAAGRLDEACSALAGLGIAARAEIGSDDPLRAVEDALRTFPADEIVVSTHPPERSNWLERGVVERLCTFYELPVTHVVADAEGLEEHWRQCEPETVAGARPERA
jgi:hypothetical protein